MTLWLSPMRSRYSSKPTTAEWHVTSTPGPELAGGGVDAPFLVRLADEHHRLHGHPCPPEQLPSEGDVLHHLAQGYAYHLTACYDEVLYRLHAEPTR
ncbi:hypothetical protein GCM10023347_04730 [Streptomyces chumphonensis]